MDALSTGTFWGNENDAMLALTGIYNTDLQNQVASDFLAPYTLISLDLTTDNGYEKDQYLQGFNSGLMNSTNGTVSTLWQTSYSRIAKCNNFLEHISQVKMDVSDKEEMIAEVRTIRAYYYFNLEFYWGDVPLVTKVLTINEADNVTRTPRKQVVQFVLSELQSAITSLPEIPPNGERGRITKGAALAILGRVQMAQGLWQDAAKTYKQIIDMGIYSLDPNFVSLFMQSDENSPENIFSINAIPGSNIYGRSIQRHVLPFMYGGYHQVNVFNSLVESFDCIDGKPIDESPLYNPNSPYKNRDPRLYATVFIPELTVFKGRLYVASPDSVNAPDMLTKRNWSGYGLKKFADENYTGPITQYGGSFAIIRYSEVLLSYLECEIETGATITQGLLDQTINLVRTRVHMPPVTETNPEKLMPILRRERRNELAFEGLRLYDLLRWGIADSVLNNSFYGMKLTNDPSNYTKLPVNSDGYFFCESKHFRKGIDNLWPIPQSEIDINPKLTQNPGF